MLMRNVTYSLLATVAVICMQTADAAHRRKSKAKKPQTGTMSLVELRTRQFENQAITDYKTGKWQNGIIFSSDHVPGMSPEEDGPAKEPTCVITRGDLQSIIARASAWFPCALGAASSIATGNPLPLYLGGTATAISLKINNLLQPTDDYMAEERALQKDLSAIIDAVEHDRWAKQHPRFAAIRARQHHLKKD